MKPKTKILNQKWKKMKHGGSKTNMGEGIDVVFAWSRVVDAPSTRAYVVVVIVSSIGAKKTRDCCNT